MSSCIVGLGFRHVNTLRYSELNIIDGATGCASGATYSRRTPPEGSRRAFSVEIASGSVALRDGLVTGYLIGAPKPGWGPDVWVDSAGHAVHEAETIRISSTRGSGSALITTSG
jgi:hypothetical protein